VLHPTEEGDGGVQIVAVEPAELWWGVRQGLAQVGGRGNADSDEVVQGAPPIVVRKGGPASVSRRRA